MTQDNARKWTDKELNLLEKKIVSVYHEAYGDMTKKWNKYLTNAGNRVASLQNEYDKALKSGDNDLIKEAKKKLDDAKKNVTFRNKQYQDMLNDTTTRMAKANEIALSYINNKVPAIYTANYNEIQNNLDKTKINFTLTNENVVKRLVKNGDIELPKKRLDIPKDKQWNTKQLNSSILQGIIQGESMNKIAKRIRPIVDNNANAAIRNARTMVTGAENSGRLDSYDDLQEEGLILKKVWIATGDERTREWHLTMDGQEVNIDEPFIDGNGNEIMYPGDPSAPPETVYNCRCSMRTHIVGIKTSSGKIKKLDYEQDFSEHEKQIEQEEYRRQKEIEQKEVKKQTPHHTVDGKDITLTFERRNNKFDFEIDDIINTQGFDGKPVVVSADEFEKAVKESNFVAQRTYSAPDQETLDLYRQQLYDGKFYVNCQGGSAYGEGMYSASNYDGKITDGMRDEMSRYIRSSNYNYEPSTEETKMEIINNYIENSDFDGDKRTYAIEYIKAQAEMENLNYDIIDKITEHITDKEMERLDNVVNLVTHSYEGPRTYIETFTLTKDAKIIDYQDLHKLMDRWNDERGRELFDKSTKTRQKYDNEGTFAAALGYDAIRVNGRGQSGSYTVILNRTKVIFRKD